MIKVFLCIMDMNLLKDLVNLHKEYDIEIVGYANKIPKDLDFLVELEVDAIIVRDAINVKRANTMMEKIRNIEIYKHIHMIHIFKEIDGGTFHTLTQSCICNYLLEPYTAKDVLLKVREDVERGDHERNLVKFIEDVGSKILIENGIPDNLKGYSYMKAAAYVMIQSPVKIAMNRVYEEIARQHATSADCVEKAIRVAIHQAYEANPEKLIFQGDRHTNGDVIKMMIELLKIRGMMF